MRRWTIAVAAVFVVATAVLAQGPRDLITTEQPNLGQGRKWQGDFIKAGIYRINRHRIDFAHSYKNAGSEKEWMMVYVGGHSNPIQLTGDAIKEFENAIGPGQAVEILEPVPPPSPKPPHTPPKLDGAIDSVPK